MTPTSNVLVVTHTAQLGGAELSLLRLCEALDSSHQIKVLCFESGQLVDQLRDLGVDVEVLEPVGTWVNVRRESTRNPAGLLGMAAGTALHAARVAARIRKLRPAVVQSWTIKAHLVTTIARPFYRRPLVWFLHDRITDEYLGRFNRIVIAALSRAPDFVLANSEATAATVGRPCVVAYPGLTAAQFAAPGAVSRRAAPSRPQLLLLGRISETKGQREAILAFARVLGAIPTARLRIVGKPLFGAEAYERECRDLVSELGLDHSVEFVGHSPDPRQDLDRATVLVHASPVPEPFGQVVAEAMARCVPVIATDAGGVPEMLRRDGQEYGYLVPPGDHLALADAAVSVLGNPDEASLRAQRAYDLARAMFTIERTIEIVTETWRSCVSIPSSSTAR